MSLLKREYAPRGRIFVHDSVIVKTGNGNLYRVTVAVYDYAVGKCYCLIHRDIGGYFQGDVFILGSSVKLVGVIDIVKLGYDRLDHPVLPDIERKRGGAGGVG